MSSKQQDPLDIEVGRRVRALRLEKGMSQEKLGNQLALTSLLAVQWLVAKQAGLLTGNESDASRRSFAWALLAQPAAFLVALVVALVAPESAMVAVAISIALFTALTRRLGRPAAAHVPAS